MLKVRPETAKSSLAFLGIDASGYLPFNEPLVALIANGETRAGEHLIDVTLTPE